NVQEAFRIMKTFAEELRRMEDLGVPPEKMNTEQTQALLKAFEETMTNAWKGQISPGKSKKAALLEQYASQIMDMNKSMESCMYLRTQDARSSWIKKEFTGTEPRAHFLVSMAASFVTSAKAPEKEFGPLELAKLNYLKAHSPELFADLLSKTIDSIATKVGTFVTNMQSDLVAGLKSPIEILEMVNGPLKDLLKIDPRIIEQTKEVLKAFVQKLEEKLKTFTLERNNTALQNSSLPQKKTLTEAELEKLKAPAKDAAQRTLVERWARLLPDRDMVMRTYARQNPK